MTIKIMNQESSYYGSLYGHTSDITIIKTQNSSPGTISGNRDGTIILWDLSKKSPIVVLKNHTKIVRGLVIDKKNNIFYSAGRDYISKCTLQGKRLENVSEDTLYLKSLDFNHNNLLVPKPMTDLYKNGIY